MIRFLKRALIICLGVLFIFSLSLSAQNEAKSISNQEEVSDIKDIKGPVAFPQRRGILYVVLALLFLGGGIAFFLWRRKRGVQEKPIIEIPADKIALKRLEALKKKNLPAQGMIKEFYTELSNIVRHYIEKRFKLRAPEMTTEEFLLSLKDSESLSFKQKELLREFLVSADMVKFAKYGPAEKEMDGSFESAVRLVEETKEVRATKDEGRRTKREGHRFL